MLESLGWRFHRIWSTDWFRNPGQELERTAAAIEGARQAAKLNKPVDITIKPVSAPIILRDVVADNDMATVAMAYRKAKIPTMTSAGYALHEAPTDRLSMLVKSVVEVESPVHEAEVTKRLMESFGVSRAGNRIVESVGIAIGHGHRTGIFHHSGGFVYADKSRAAAVRNRGGLEATERKIEWVSPEELDTALLDVVRTGFSISQDAAVSGALESLGFGRVTTNIATTVNARVASLLKEKRLTRQDEKLVIA